MGGRKWTEDEIEFLENNHKHLSHKKMSDILNRSYNSVQLQCSRLNFNYEIAKVGDKFNRLIMIEIYESNESGRGRKAKFECDCGSTIIRDLSKVVYGHTKSCGCLKSEVNSKRMKQQKYGFKHGLHKTRIYRIWGKMKDRCYNSYSESNKRIYKDRGITVCDEWKNNFIEFYQWAMSHGYNEKLTIDRIDNDKGYFPENCRWATSKQQANNTRSNRILYIFGEYKTVMEWFRDVRCKIQNEQTLRGRLKRGWSPKKAITTPVMEIYRRNYNK